MSQDVVRAWTRTAALAITTSLLLACSKSKPSCNTCPAAGATQCSGAQVQTCSPDPNGCLAWAAATDCRGGLACAQGACPVCDACPAAGAKGCSGLQIRSCQTGVNGCLVWSEPEDCPAGVTCNAALAACVDRLVDLSWAANREHGVNSAGGGYRVSVPGQADVLVPYVSGASAPTTTSVRMPPGSHVVSVRAYAALDAQGGSGGSLSAPAQITVSVP